MDGTTIVVADGSSAVVQYADLLVNHRKQIEDAAARDAWALKILTGSGLVEADRRYWANYLGHPNRRIWTRKDEKRLAWIHGYAHHWEACRLYRAIERFHDLDAYRDALDETRSDGTAAVVFPKLEAAHEAHKSLLDRARQITEWQSLPLPSLDTEEVVEGNNALSALINHTRKPRRPAGDPAAGSQVHPPGRKAKRSAGPNTAMPKAIAALVKYHRDTPDGSVRTDPISTRELQRIADVGAGTVSALWKKHFGDERNENGSHLSYSIACRNGRIDLLLQIMAGEMRAGHTLANLRNAADQVLDLP